MGMAASQARLLSLTARLHDVEFEAQSIEAAKLQLADAEDAVYQKYLEALDATQITGSILQGTETATVFATFNNLAGGWENMILTSGAKGELCYGLVNQKTGNLYVTQDMYDAYQEYSGNDSDEFALKRLGYTDEEISAFIKHRNSKGSFYPMENATETMATKKITGVDPSTESYDPSKTYYTLDPETGGYKEVSGTDMGKNYLKVDESGNQVFNENAGALFVEMAEDDTRTPAATIVDYNKMYEELKSDEGRHYKHSFEMIKARGGCEVLDPDYQNDPEWLTNMVGFGNVGIYTLKNDETAPRGYKMQQTSTSSSSTLKDTNVTSMDSTELKRAEAEYNKELKAINKKDTKYDLALEELETERTAITTELESLRTVIDENIDRTFKTFS